MGSPVRPPSAFQRRSLADAFPVVYGMKKDTEMKDIFDLWTDTAFKMKEMINLSVPVIARRTSMMALSAWMPTAYDHCEINRMGIEKYDAAKEVIEAVDQSINSSGQRITTLVVKQAFAATIDLMLFGCSLTPGHVKRRQEKFVNNIIDGIISNGNEFSVTLAHATAESLQPLHKRITENAKRLTAKEIPSYVAAD